MDVCASAQEPITTDLRRWFDQHMKLMADDELREGFGNLCDAIDAVQKNLERENARMMPLPLDADGEPIRVGDKLVGEKVGGGYCEPFEVIGYVMSNGVIEPMDEHMMPRMAKYAHHHRKDTWERIIGDAINGHNGIIDFDGLIARCRALAGETS